MSFPFNLYAAALIASFVITLVALPIWRKWSYRSGLVDDPGHRKIHDQPISLAGGLAVFTGMLIPVVGGILIFFLLRSVFSEHSAGVIPVSVLEHGVSRRALQLAMVILGAAGMLLIGWLDDKHELRPGPKFLGQAAIALLVAVAGIRITLFVDNIFFSYLVTVLWILTVINAFNFMDNMNGLCAGLGCIGAWFFAVSAAVQGQYLVVLLSLLAVGALLGFLPFNYPKASVFLGDAGSHLVGYLLAVLAILPHFYSSSRPETWAVLTPLLVLAVPLGDMVWVVLIRWRLGKPFYIGDNNHLSHRLVRRGLSRSTAVALIWLMAALFGTLMFLL